jgi:serine/threonine protein kinase
MGTPPEGPALERPHDTTVDDPKRRRRGPSIAHDRTITPVNGVAPVSSASSGAFSLMPTTIAGPKPKELEPGVMVGEYQIEGLLGEGGMGRVYSAVHPVIGKRAAIKVLHPRMSSNLEVVERFIQEARAVNQIGHPNIVDIFAFSTFPDGTHYFVMEWLKGESLQERMRRQRLSRDEICHFVTDICHALEAAHEQGIVHRDLKPENVFLQQIKGDRPRIKLLDFGIAKLAATEDNRIERTRTGAMMGTPKYIAPEQARGYAVDHRVDVYSLGVMIFELVAGRLPFEADNAMDLVAAHLQDTPPLLSMVCGDIPRILDEVVYTMLAKEADERPSLPHLRQILADVRAMPPGDSAYTVPDLRISGLSLPSVAPAPRSKGWMIVGALMTAAALVGGFVIARSMQTPDPEPPTLAPIVKPIAATDPPPKPATKPPDPPPVKVIEPGTLVVKLKRGTSGVTLVVDGKEQPGKGPTWELALEPGEHKVTLAGPKVQAAVQIVMIESGKPTPIELGIAPTVMKRWPPNPNTTKPTGSSQDDFLPPTKKP